MTRRPDVEAIAARVGRVLLFSATVGAPPFAQDVEALCAYIGELEAVVDAAKDLFPLVGGGEMHARVALGRALAALDKEPTR